jgi:hypothetical protein
MTPDRADFFRLTINADLVHTSAKAAARVKRHDLVASTAVITGTHSIVTSLCATTSHSGDGKHFQPLLPSDKAEHSAAPGQSPPPPHPPTVRLS